MVRCIDCLWVGYEDELVKKTSGLGDSPWGKGESIIMEWHCPECGSDNLEDGRVCPECDEFVTEGNT